PEPRRFSIQSPRLSWIGVAAAVLVVIAMGVELGVPIYRQQRAMAAIRDVTSRRPRHHGVIVELNGSTVTFSVPPVEEELEFCEIGPPGLTELLGESAFWNRLTAVNLAMCKIEDSELALLRQFPSVERVVLYHSSVSDA